MSSTNQRRVFYVVKNGKTETGTNLTHHIPRRHNPVSRFSPYQPLKINHSCNYLPIHTNTTNFSHQIQAKIYGNFRNKGEITKTNNNFTEQIRLCFFVKKSKLFYWPHLFYFVSSIIYFNNNNCIDGATSRCIENFFVRSIYI